MRFPALDQLPINDDVNAEFDFWKRQLLGACTWALGLSLTTGLLVALALAYGADDDFAAFLRDMWPALVMLGLWLGLLIGLLAGAARRFGGALVGLPPWLEPRGAGAQRQASARQFAQGALMFGLVGTALALTSSMLAGAVPAAQELLTGLAPLWRSALAASALFAVVAAACRGRQQPPLTPSAAARRQGNRG